MLPAVGARILPILELIDCQDVWGDMTEKGRRQFRVRMRVSYAGGTLAEDDQQALRHALSSVAPEYSLSVSSDLYDAVEIAYGGTAARAPGSPRRRTRPVREGAPQTHDLRVHPHHVSPAAGRMCER